MEDLPIPESGGEAIVIFVIAVVIVGLYMLVRRTQQSHHREMWERRERERNLRLAEPEDPTQLPSEWVEREPEPPPEV